MSSNHKISTLLYEGYRARVEFDCDTYTQAGTITHHACSRYVRDRRGYKMFCKLDMLSAVYIRLPPTRVSVCWSNLRDSWVKIAQTMKHGRSRFLTTLAQFHSNRSRLIHGVQFNPFSRLDR
ncbi:uncharacterized protein [Mycetomoellerius zeteki]|uniref:uncharacterized protein n=1 Tax=Mycetomoellerius zeteki TaxID=64791 RepID=UPI00084EA67A|nr:PREDICTED: uncharacterized protein LOC108731803 [Trachymyrmex zeteki]